MDVRAQWWDDSLRRFAVSVVARWIRFVNGIWLVLHGEVCPCWSFIVMRIATFGIAIRLVPFASFTPSRAAALLPAGTLFLPRQFVTLAFGVKLSLWRNALQFLST